jgi:hypothetical protein
VAAPPEPAVTTVDAVAPGVEVGSVDVTARVVEVAARVVDDGRKSKTYWAGALNSEWATVYVVTLVQGSEHR